MTKSYADEVSEAAEKVAELASALLERVKLVQSQSTPSSEDQLANEPGLAFLATKLELLLSYCINITFICLIKVEGGSIEGHPIVGQLLLIQGVFERVRPLDAKMKHQLNKLIQLVAKDSQPSDGSNSVNSDVHLRPRLANLVPVGEQQPRGELGTVDDDEGIDDYGENNGSENSKVYQPPKLTAVPFDDERGSSSNTTEAREARRMERMRSRINASETLQNVRSEVLGTPEEVAGGTSGVASLGKDALARVRREDAERQEWEEEHMMRRQVTKKERTSRKRLLAQANRLETIADVGDLSGVWGPARQSKEDGFDRGSSDGADRSGSGKKKKKKGYKGPF